MEKRFKFKSSALLFLMLSLTIPGCGKKGPLKLEPIVAPEKITDPVIIQTGGDLSISWKFPQYLSDKKTKFIKTKLKRVYIVYSEKELPVKLFKKRGKFLKKINSFQISESGKLYNYTIKNIQKKFGDKKIFICLYYKYGRSVSSISEIKEITIVNPIKPVDDLSLLNENKVIKLKWSRQNLNIDNKKSDEILGYDIYRKVVEKNGKESQFTKINKDTVVREFYEDSDTGSDGTYSYYVKTVILKNNFSRKSNIVSIEVKDIYPPEIPVNLIVFKSPKGLLLSWDQVKDKDLAYYNIYKKGENSSDFSLVGKGETKNRYLDIKVKRGKKYFYYVTATDNNGNESDNSKTASEEF